jgi:hypothetical protein
LAALLLGYVMLRWFKSTKTDEAIRAAASKIIEPLAFAIAVSETEAEYFRAQNNVPISKFHDGESNVMEIWMGTRLEAISRLWNFGAAKRELIINPETHPRLLDAIIQIRPFLPLREVTGDEIQDSISAICRVYDYLDQLERDLAVPFRSPSGDYPGSISRYASFVLEMQKLYPKWQAFQFALRSNAPLPDIPETIFISLWRDITFRAKMIALCSKLGPSYMATMAALRKKVTEANEDSSPTDSMFVKIRSADDPDRIE